VVSAELTVEAAVGCSRGDTARPIDALSSAVKVEAARFGPPSFATSVLKQTRTHASPMAQAIGLTDAGDTAQRNMHKLDCSGAQDPGVEKHWPIAASIRNRTERTMSYGVCHPSQVGAAQYAMDTGLVKPMRLVPSKVVPVGELMVFSDETLIPVLDTIDRLLVQRERSYGAGRDRSS